MTRLAYLLAFSMAIILTAMTSESANAQEPTWYPYTIARGQDREIIKNTPMELRPYRPFHFYGNTVRRSYYRGNPMPLPRDVIRGTAAVLTRRR